MFGVSSVSRISGNFVFPDFWQLRFPDFSEQESRRPGSRLGCSRVRMRAPVRAAPGRAKYRGASEPDSRTTAHRPARETPGRRELGAKYGQSREGRNRVNRAVGAG